MGTHSTVVCLTSHLYFMALCLLGFLHVGKDLLASDDIYWQLQPVIPGREGANETC